jgi:uncharacterized protein YegP (UPF0339 family)
MMVRKLLLTWLAAVSLIACQQVDAVECGEKCDTFDQAIGAVMPRAPVAPGAIGVVRDGATWRFQVVGAKGAIVLLSKEFTERTAVINGVLAAEENGVIAERYAVVPGAAGGFTVELRAGNNSVIADSEPFATEEQALAAAAQARDLVAGIVQYRAALSRGAQFKLARDGSRWAFTLVDEGGNALLISQDYSRRTDAVTGIESVRANGRDRNRFELVDSPVRFILKASNGREIGESATTFDSPEAALAVIGTINDLIASERVANPW